MAFIEKTIDSKIVYDGPIFKIRKYKVEAVGGGTTYRDVLEHGGGAAMIAIRDDGKILMVKQYRKTLDRIVLEIPAGKRDPGETTRETAARELREETGYSAGEVEYLTTLNPSVGYSEELLDIYICRGLTEGEIDFDSTEDLDLEEYEADELYEMVLGNKIVDAKTALAILFARAEGKI